MTDGGGGVSGRSIELVLNSVPQHVVFFPPVQP